VQPFVLGLDVSNRIAPQQVLEGAEIDQRLFRGDFGRVAFGIAGHVLPAGKVRVRFEVRLPSVLHSGLEGEHQHALGPEFFCELVAGEGFAKAHLGVPQEARGGFFVLRPDRVEVVVGLVHRYGLFLPHGEGLRVRAGELLSGAQLGEHGLHVLQRAAHPFQFSLRKVLLDQGCAHLVIGKSRAVVALGGLVEFDLEVLDRGSLELFGDALLHIARGLPHLQQSRVRLVRDGVGVDARPGFRLGHEDLFNGLIHHRFPSGWTR